MADTISKVIGILLAFALLVIAPMVMSRLAEDMASKRLVLNEVTLFIDKVADKGSVTAADIDDLLIGINSYGGTFDVAVTRYIPVTVRDNAIGSVKTTYIASDDNIGSLTGSGTVYFEPGDSVQVCVEGISLTKGQSFIRRLLYIDEKPFGFSLAGMVR